MKKIILGVVAVMSLGMASAQQIQYQSQYMLNPYMINPAAAGSMDDIPIALSFRQQWAGFNDAPMTQMLCAHTMIRKDMAVGTLFSNDITGPLSKFSWQATYAYHLPVGKKDRLSFGLSAQMQYYTLDQSVLVLHHETDDVINGAKQKSLVPDFNFGMYYFGERHFAGVSIPQVFNAKINIGDDVVVRNKERQHMFVHGGYRFQLAEKWMLEPSAIIKMINKAPINVDINTRVEYDKFLWAGISYRHDDSMVALMGLTHNQFRIGYSYDFTTSNIRKYSAGTHELYLQHTLKLSKLSKSSM